MEELAELLLQYKNILSDYNDGWLSYTELLAKFADATTRCKIHIDALDVDHKTKVTLCTILDNTLKDIVLGEIELD